MDSIKKPDTDPTKVPGSGTAKRALTGNEYVSFQSFPMEKLPNGLPQQFMYTRDGSKKIITWKKKGESGYFRKGMHTLYQCSNYLSFALVHKFIKIACRQICCCCCLLCNYCSNWSRVGEQILDYGNMKNKTLYALHFVP